MTAVTTPRSVVVAHHGSISLSYVQCVPARAIERRTPGRTGMPQPLECLIIGRITTQSPVVVAAVRIAQELRVRRPHTPSGRVLCIILRCVRDRFACGDLPAARSSAIAHAASRQPRGRGRVRRTNEVAERPSATDDDLDLCSWIGGLARVVWCAVRARRQPCTSEEMTVVA